MAVALTPLQHRERMEGCHDGIDFFALIIGFIIDVWTGLFDGLAKPASNTTILLLGLYVAYKLNEIRQTQFAHFNASTDTLNRLAYQIDSKLSPLHEHHLEKQLAEAIAKFGEAVNAQRQP